MQWSNYENNMAIDESATTVFPNLIKWVTAKKGLIGGGTYD